MEMQNRFLYDFKTKILTDKKNQTRIEVHYLIFISPAVDNYDLLSFGLGSGCSLYINYSFDLFKKLNKLLFLIDNLYNKSSYCLIVEKGDTIFNIMNLFSQYCWANSPVYEINSNNKTLVFFKKRILYTKSYIEVLENLLKAAKSYKLNDKTIHYIKFAYCVGENIYDFIQVFKKLKQVILKDNPSFQLEELEKTMKRFEVAEAKLENVRKNLKQQEIERKNEIFSIVKIIKKNLLEFCSIKDLQKRIIAIPENFAKEYKTTKEKTKKEKIIQKLNKLERYFEYGFNNCPKVYLGGSEGPYTIAYRKYKQKNKSSNHLGHTQFDKYFLIWFVKKIFLYRNDKIIEIFKLKEKITTYHKKIDYFIIELEEYLGDTIKDIDEPNINSTILSATDEEQRIFFNATDEEQKIFCNNNNNNKNSIHKEKFFLQMAQEALQDL